MNYIIVNIGCIECGVSSNIVGVFDDEAKAIEIVKSLEGRRKFTWREGGQNSYEIFPMPKLNAVNAEYADYAQ